jgi:tape measure domain-containing protein
MTTAYQVDLVFGTRQADTQLARMEQRLRGVDRTAAGAGGRDSFGGISRGAQAATGKVEMLVGGLKAFAALGVVTAAGAMANSIFRLAVAAENTDVRIRGLTKGLDDYNRFQEVASVAAAKFGMSQQEAQAGLAQTYARLRPLGFTLSEVRDVYEGFNTAARNAGATAQESEGAFRQLAQALGSGALRGDEFNSIMEQTPAVGIEVAKVLGINAGELRDLAAEGKLTSDVVLKALQNIRTEGADQLSKSLDTTGANVEKLKNRFVDMGTVVGGSVMPPVLATLKALNELLDLATQNAGSLGFALQQAMNLAGNPVINSLTNGVNFINRLPGGRGVTNFFAEQLGYGPKQETFGPFLPEGLEQRTRNADQARRRAEAAAKEADKKGRSRGGSGSGPDFPAYISANQMRTWLKSQGYERTSGDFTNKGHRTPNHMLNAIDIGELDGSYSFAVQRARALERQLRATGAFGNQLFGPNSDPRGHKDHVHIPTPGGRIRVTPGLARLMNLGGKGSGGLAMQEADWANEAAEKEAEREEKRREGLATAQDMLRVSRQELDLASASTEQLRIQVGYANEQADIKTKFTKLLEGSASAEETTTLQNAQQLELDRARLDYNLRLNDALLRRIGLSGELLDMSRFTGTGAGARGQSFDLSGTLADTTREEEKVNRLEQAIGSASDAYGSFMGSLISGTATAEDALADLFQGIADSFADMVAQMLAEWAKAQLLGLLMPKGPGGGGGGTSLPGGIGTSDNLFSTGLGIAGSLLSFDGGGSTGAGPRTGGLDGKGGFAAILHPNETVVDHTGGQGMGGAQVTNNINVSVSSDGQAQVDGTGGGELARGIQAAVTAEILRQQRPGGVLAGARGR